MKSRLFSPILLAAALLLGSCDALFTSNLFKEANLGQLDSTTLSTKSSSELVAEASPALYTALEADATAKAAVLDTLEATYTDPNASSADVQAAAALAAQVELETTGASDLINGVVGVLTLDLNFSSMTSSDVVSTIESLVPTSLSSSQTAFTAAIQGLLDSKAALDALGTSIGSDGTADTTIDVGTAAQSALVATVLSTINYSAATDSTGTPYTSVSALLWDVSQGTPGITTTGLSLSLNTSTGTPLGNLLLASGLDLTALGL